MPPVFGKKFRHAAASSTSPARPVISIFDEFSIKIRYLGRGASQQFTGFFWSRAPRQPAQSVRLGISTTYSRGQRPTESWSLSQKSVSLCALHGVFPTSMLLPCAASSRRARRATAPGTAFASLTSFLVGNTRNRWGVDEAAAWRNFFKNRGHSGTRVD